MPEGGGIASLQDPGARATPIFRNQGLCSSEVSSHWLLRCPSPTTHVCPRTCRRGRGALHRRQQRGDMAWASPSGGHGQPWSGQTEAEVDTAGSTAVHRADTRGPQPQGPADIRQGHCGLTATIYPSMGPFTTSCRVLAPRQSLSRLPPQPSTSCPTPGQQKLSWPRPVRGAFQAPKCDVGMTRTLGSWVLALPGVGMRRRSQRESQAGRA